MSRMEMLEQRLRAINEAHDRACCDALDVQIIRHVLTLLCSEIRLMLEDEIRELRGASR